VTPPERAAHPQQPTGPEQSRKRSTTARTGSRGTGGTPPPYPNPSYVGVSGDWSIPCGNATWRAEKRSQKDPAPPTV
jgi:hypothetical protein